MRVLARAAAVLIVIGSCGTDSVGPIQSCTTEPRLELGPPDLRLPLGARDHVQATLVTADCGADGSLSGSEITWTSRDPSVATLQPGPSGWLAPTVSPEGTGGTFVVAEARGFRDSVSVTVPDTSAVGPFTDLATGGDVSCGAMQNGESSCWGAGPVMEALPSAETLVGTCFGRRCSPMPVPQAGGATSLRVGWSHACSLDPGGNASCWGDNFNGQLGRGSTSGLVGSAAVVGGHTFTSLALGSSHTCGIRPDRVAFCWGNGEGGRLGTLATGGNSPTPQPVADEHRWISIDARDETTCGVTDSGELYCWGILGPSNIPVPGAQTCERSTKGGSVTYPCSPRPLLMPLGNVSPADSVFVQVGGPCALTDKGSVYCRDEAQPRFVRMPGFGPFTTIAGGAEHTCGLSAGGSASCWGRNPVGQLGGGDFIDRAAPAPVQGQHTFVQIAVGEFHSCGLDVAGDVWCWGANNVGQVGTTVEDGISAPVRVRGQR